MMRRYIAIGSIVVWQGCGGGAPAPRAPVAEVTAPPAVAVEAHREKAQRRTEPADPACDANGLPPPELVADNLSATELSGLAEILEASVSDPKAVSGYVNVRYDVRVLEQFTGPATPDELRLSQGVEAPARPLAAGTLLFFSACRSGEAAAFEPDVGYFFPISPGCRHRFEALVRSAQKQAESRTGPASACVR